MTEKNGKAERLRDVEADFINPFLASMYETMVRMGETSSSRGQAVLFSTDKFSAEVLVVMEVEGTINGFVIIQMSAETARKLVSVFLLGVPIGDLDEMAMNSIREFALRVAEKAKKQLLQKNYFVNVRFEVNINSPIDLRQKYEFIRVPYMMGCGELTVFFNVTKSGT